MKKRRIIIAGSIVFLIAIFCACGGSSSVGSSNAQSSSSSSNNTSSSASTPPKSGKIGDTLKTSSWSITLKDASIDTAPPDYDQPTKSGDVFLLIDVSAKNLSSKSQDISSIGDFKLTDQSGQSYNLGIDSNAKSSPDGKVSVGSPVAGTLVYEVPSTIKKFHLEFTPDILNNDDSAGFDFSVK
jgi:hypothetical protein